MNMTDVNFGLTIHFHLEIHHIFPSLIHTSLTIYTWAILDQSVCGVLSIASVAKHGHGKRFLLLGVLVGEGLTMYSKYSLAGQIT